MSETSLYREQAFGAVKGRAVPQIKHEAKALTDTNRALIELAEKAEKQATALAQTMLMMRSHLLAEGVHGVLNRRDLPGLSVRNFEKDLLPWATEFLAWKLGSQVTSSFKVFSADTPLAKIIARDQARIDEEAVALVERAQRGW